jgi:hypothetical protein
MGRPKKVMETIGFTNEENNGGVEIADPAIDNADLESDINFEAPLDDVALQLAQKAVEAAHDEAENENRLREIDKLLEDDEPVEDYCYELEVANAKMIRALREIRVCTVGSSDHRFVHMHKVVTDALK